MDDRWIATVRTVDGGSYRGTGKNVLSCEPTSKDDAIAWATTMVDLDPRLALYWLEEVKPGR